MIFGAHLLVYSEDARTVRSSMACLAGTRSTPGTAGRSSLFRRPKRPSAARSPNNPRTGPREMRVVVNDDGLCEQDANTSAVTCVRLVQSSLVIFVASGRRALSFGGQSEGGTMRRTVVALAFVLSAAAFGVGSA